MKSPAVVAALISAGIAALVSAGTTLLTMQREMDKLAIATQQGALDKIIEARLLAYKDAYRLMSQLSKDANKEPVRLEYLERLLAEYDSWDSNNGYLLGPVSTNTAFEFRQHLFYMVSSSTLDEANLQTLLSNAGKLELGLRSDLGIYGFRLGGPDFDLNTPKLDHYFTNSSDRLSQ